MLRQSLGVSGCGVLGITVICSTFHRFGQVFLVVIALKMLLTGIASWWLYNSYSSGLISPLTLEPPFLDLSSISSTSEVVSKGSRRSNEWGMSVFCNGEYSLLILLKNSANISAVWEAVLSGYKDSGVHLGGEFSPSSFLTVLWKILESVFLRKPCRRTHYCVSSSLGQFWRFSLLM